MASDLLVTHQLCKRFGEIHALTDVNISFKIGEVVGLVGGNGAGKTTLLRLLSGLYSPTSGSVELFLDDGSTVPVENLRQKLGVVPEATGLYHRFSAWENIRYHSRLHGIDDERAWTRTQRFAQALDFESNLHRPTRGFSKGMRQKTAIIRALVHGPEVLLLDEPTAGLDVTSARMVRSLVRQLGDEAGTVIYSTHHLAEAERVCDRIVIIHNGTLRASGTPQFLMSDTKTTSLEDAYVALTADVARTDPPADDRGAVSRWWSNVLVGRSLPKQPEIISERDPEISSAKISESSSIPPTNSKPSPCITTSTHTLTQTPTNTPTKTPPSTPRSIQVTQEVGGEEE
jgi:sodium transport system ATP-binding protein